MQSFITTPDGQLTGPLGSASSEGVDSPAHAVVLSTDEIVLLNYYDGTARIVPISEDLLTFDESLAQLITFPFPVDGASLPHEGLEYNGELFVADIGADTIYRLTQEDGSWNITGDIPQPEGSGPRHILFYGTFTTEPCK